MGNREWVKAPQIIILIFVVVAIFMAGCITQKQAQVPENFLYIGTLYTNCHVNPISIQSDKQLVTLSGKVELLRGSRMFPWEVATINDHALFDASNNLPLSGITTNELVGKNVIIRGYYGLGVISQPAYWNKSELLTQNFTDALFVTDIKGWQKVCCTAPSSENVCIWLPNNYKFELPECVTDADCAGKPIPKEYQNVTFLCKELENGSMYCPQQKWLCETGKCEFRII
jgi:hypothetical protein